MKKLLSLVRLFVGIATMAATLGATLIQPTDLSPGDAYRFIFVTDARTPAISSNISDYNNVVASEVAITPELFALGTTWTALASTPTVDVFTNTGLSLTDTNTRFYNTLGELIAVGTQVPVTGLYDVRGTTSHTARIYPITIEGSLPSEVYTGTERGGFSPHIFRLGTLLVSDECGSVPCSFFGYAWTLDMRWTEANIQPSVYPLSLYGVSGELTATAGVPEPTTLSMFLIGVLALVVTKRKHRCLRQRTTSQSH